MPTTNNTTRPTTFAFTRTFGVEIELKGLSIRQATSVLVAGGVDAVNIGYTHDVTTGWKVVEDGSVHGGCEVVSPVMSGQAGLDEVVKVCNLLRAAGGHIDSECGLHVHVDANDLTGAELINAVRRYNDNESSIDAVMPVSRRNSNWARRMGDVVSAVRNLPATVSPRAVVEAVSNQYVDRYRKLNLHSFLRHGTVEFRQHSGTVDGFKIVNWIVFCVTFIEDSRIAPLVVVTPVVAVAVPSVPVVRTRVNALSTKFAKLLNILSRSSFYNLVSAGTIAAELEISEASVPSYVSMFRDRHPTLRITRRRGRGYYCENPQTAQAMVRGESAPVAQTGGTTLGDLIRQNLASAAPMAPSSPVVRGIFDNLPLEVASYFSERAADLAAA